MTKPIQTLLLALACLTGQANEFAGTHLDIPEQRDLGVLTSISPIIKAQLIGDDQPLIARMTGDAVLDWRKMTGSPGPFYAQTSVIRHYARPDCKRLKIRITAMNTPARNAAGQTTTLNYVTDMLMNICADGLPPPDSVALETMPTPPIAIPPSLKQTPGLKQTNIPMTR